MKTSNQENLLRRKRKKHQLPNQNELSKENLK